MARVLLVREVVQESPASDRAVIRMQAVWANVEFPQGEPKPPSYGFAGEWRIVHDQPAHGGKTE